MTRQIKCPKQDFEPCIGEECGWWVPLRSAEGEVTGRCSILHIAVSLDPTAMAMRCGSGDDNDVEKEELH